MSSEGDVLKQRAEDLLQERAVSRALVAFDAAEMAQADADKCSAGRWTAHMLMGEFESAWRESDAIRGRNASDPNRFWTGEDLDGRRVMLRCLHGYGDAVQMLRYAPKLRARTARLIVEMAPELVELAGYFEGVDEVICWGKEAPVPPPEWDVQMELMELPYIFRTRLDDLPIADRYLRLPPAEVLINPTFPEHPLQVGLVWASGSWNPSRSVPLELLRPLLRMNECTFWNLQGGAASAQAIDRADGPNLHADPQCAQSVLGLAQTIARLDLVITPDTLAAHLAGALGTPAWVMLPYTADWRWMLERADSPWYPSLRLFRQPTEGDWQSVVHQIQAELATLLAVRSKGLLVASDR